MACRSGQGGKTREPSVSASSGRARWGLASVQKYTTRAKKKRERRKKKKGKPQVSRKIESHVRVYDLIERSLHRMSTYYINSLIMVHGVCKTLSLLYTNIFDLQPQIIIARN